MVGVFHAIAGATGLYSSYLANLPPELRRVVLAEMQRARELDRLDRSAEVAFAREEIQREGLSGEFAERLLEFARDLARRRES